MTIYIKSIVFTLCLCSLSYSFAQSNDTRPGNEIIIRSTNSSAKTCNETDDNKNVQCSDCNSLIYCKSNVTIKCPSARPFCDKSKCVTERPSTGCEIETGNVCPLYSSGKYYPDVSTCYKYYYCDLDQKALEAYDCPVGFPFDYETQACTRGKPCGSFNCFNKIIALNSANPTLGVACSENKIIEGSYVACKRSQQLDESMSCTAICQKEGNIPHETATNKYYRCLPSGPWGTLVKTEQKCPGNLVFNEKDGECGTS